MKALLLCAAIATPAPVSAANKPPAPDRLRIMFVDVEGGAATLIVTPHGRSLLIDAGWPGDLTGGRASTPGEPTSVQRIAAELRRAGLQRIDYLLVTHYHTDHVGGASELLRTVPVGTVIDHGPNRQPAAEPPPANRRGYQPADLYPVYLAAIGTRPHRIMKPGERLEIDGLVVTAIDGDGAILPRPLSGAGEAGARCERAAPRVGIGTDENPRSLGVVLRWGKARVLALGDTTRDVEEKLACPRDLIGRVDLMIADNHGSDNAGSPVLLDTVRPSLIIFNNGPAKGADEASLRFAQTAPYVRGVWQLHFATRSPAANAPRDQIVNVDGADSMQSLDVQISRSGSITMRNPRTGATRTYARPSQAES